MSGEEEEKGKEVSREEYEAENGKGRWLRGRGGGGRSNRWQRRRRK